MNQIQKAEEYKSPALKVITAEIRQMLCTSNGGRMEVIDHGSGGFGEDED